MNSRVSVTQVFPSKLPDIFFGGEIKQAVITEQEHFWVIIVFFFTDMIDIFRSSLCPPIHPSIHPSIHPFVRPYLQGPSRKQKTGGIVF